MALEYEVRAEYQSMSLSQLLDANVTCFEGVGDTQSDILNRYFGITTVRQLGNMPFFLWALGIQEMALQGGENSSQSIADLAGRETLKFAVRDNDRGKNTTELLNAAVNVLDGLTPAQNLAMYDAFRITNVIQLAHNRIMLEARVIEYLEKHPELVQGDETAEKEQVASILGTDTFVPTSGEEAQEAMSGEKPAEGLQKMAGELGEHLRSRIDALKDRAAARVQDMASEAASSGEEMAEGVESIRAATAGAGGNRLDSIRQMRERTETTRVQSVTSAMEASERAMSGADAQDATQRSEDVAAAGEGLASHGPPSTTIRPAIDGQEEAAEGADAEPAEPAEAEGAEGAEAAATEEEEETPTSAFKPWMAAAAVGAVVVLAGVVWLVSSGEEPQPPPPVEKVVPQQPPAEVIQQVEQQPPPPPPGPTIRTIHTVVKGQSLWRISRAHYQNPLLWPQIYRVNDDQIEDPDLIFPEQELKIPEPE